MKVLTGAHIILLYLLILPASLSLAQETGIRVNTDWDHERHSWKAHWVTHPSVSTLDYGAFLLRNEFRLDEMPDSLIIFVSADNRYKLYINGQLVCTGPAKGSFKYWRYEKLDLRPWLRKGNNTLAAEVFNLGEHRPAAMFSRQTAFILQVDGPMDSVLDTPGSWKIQKNDAYTAIPVTSQMVGGYYVAGPTDSIRAELYPWGWKENGFNDDDWMGTRDLGKGVGRGYMHGVKWMLIPRNIPLLESNITRFKKIARSSEPEIQAGFLKAEGSLIIPPHSQLSILLDQEYLTIGYPVIKTGGGRGSSIRITYAEALRDEQGKKGNRNEIEGKAMIGYHDIILPDGGANREFQPLWLRTWRYVQLDVSTADEALSIDDLYGISNIYPFEERGSFSSDDPSHDRIWEVGWRTARLCAGETYMDCPYYEQLQYLGDTRIQALISLYASGDDRLMRNALLTADQSRIPCGLTLSRGPSFIPQIVPAFSLYWIDMIHDYYMHRQDDEFIRQFLPGIQSVLGWFERRLDTNDMLGPLEWFNFADWTDGFMVGAPPGVDLGHSALVSLNYVYALYRAADLFSHFGQDYQAGICREQAARINRAVYDLCFNHDRGLMAGTPEKKVYSQHTNIWAILTDAIPPEDQPEVMQSILDDTNLVQTTIYFKFYLFQALRKAGMGDLYSELLGPWEEMLDKGLTTFEEGDYEERSDCHAWGASPLYDFLATVCGITPAEPGFRSVSIEPRPGRLAFVRATMPHPDGLIQMSLDRKGKTGISGMVTLPENLHGTFKWKGQSLALIPGEQKINLR
jgi:alpha-L-rhamnosidase